MAAYGALARSEREVEQLMRRVDDAVAAGQVGRDAEIVDAIQQAWDAWGQLPDDIQNQIQELVLRTWDVRGALLNRVVAFVRQLVLGQRLSVPAAVARAGPHFNLRPRTATPRRPSMTPIQVRQYHRRQLSRGRVPGRNPAFGRGRYREFGDAFDREAGRRPNPEVVHICRLAGARANQLRARRAACAGDPMMLSSLRGQANFFVRRWGNQMLGKLGSMHRDDIDLLVGCLARVEHAVGARLPALDRLRAAAARRV